MKYIVLIFTAVCLCLEATGADFRFFPKRLQSNVSQWQNNIGRGESINMLSPGKYLFSADIRLVNAAPKGKIVLMSSGGKGKNGMLYIPNSPFPCRYYLPFEMKTKSKFRIRFSGIPKLKYTGEVIVKNATICAWNSNGNILSAPDFLLNNDTKKIQGWDVSPANLQVSQMPDDSAVKGKIIKVSTSKNKVAVISSSKIFLDKKGFYTGSVWAKGNAKIRIIAYNADWKKVEAWNNKTHLASQNFLCGNMWAKYDFKFKSPEDNKKYKFRIDVKDGSIELACPDLRHQDHMDKLLSSTEKQKLKKYFWTFDKGADGAVKAENIEFVEGITGKGVKFSPTSRLEYPVDCAGKTGTVAFWMKLDNELIFDRKKEDIWSLAQTPFNSKFSCARFFFGDRYFSYPQKLFPGEWHHIAFVWDGNNGRKLFIDGRVSWTDGRVIGASASKSLRLGKSINGRSFQGTLDDLLLANRAMTETEIKKLYALNCPVTPFLIDYSGIAGQECTYRIGFDNCSGQAETYNGKVSFLDSKGKILKESDLTATPEAGSYVIKKISFTPPKAKDYIVKISNQEERSVSFRIGIIEAKAITPSMPYGNPKMKMLNSVDLCGKLDKARYRSDGKCHVTESRAGKYLETYQKSLNSGFAYKFTTQNPGKPHWIEIEYPDDSDRTFYVAASEIRNGKLWSAFLNAMGVITGGAHPITYKMQKKKLLFYPETKEFAVVLGAHQNRLGEKGPAASRLTVYENIGPLPKIKLPEQGRSVMVWNEDPTMPAYSWFKQYFWNGNSFDFWREKYERMVKYTRFIGWKQWDMQAYDYMGDNTMGDRRLISSSYGGGGGFLPGHLDMRAMTAEREKIPFYISINNMTQWSNNTWAGFALEMGLDKVQNDFTTASEKGPESPVLYTSKNTLGKVRNLALNPLHPLVMKTLLKMVRAYYEKYHIYQQFQGMDYFSAQLLYFPGANTGYGDYNINLFKAETSSNVPDYKGNERFSKRYQWLKKNAWEKWVQWRCDKVSQNLKIIVNSLNGKKFIFRISLHRLATIRSALEQGLIPNLRKELREQAGVDLNQLSTIKNLVIMPDMEPNASRTHAKKDDWRYLNFSDELTDLWKGIKEPAALINQHSNLEIYTSLATRIRIKNLWRSKQFISFSTPLPDNYLVTENLAWLLANIDPVLINHGWWGNPEAGAYDEFRKFYQAFSCLPASRFKTAPGINDPVTVRYKDKYLYLVNQARYPVTVKLHCDQPLALTDMTTEKTIQADGIIVPPMKMVVAKANIPVKINNVECRIPKQEKQRLLTSLSRLDNSPMAKQARELFKAGRYAAADFALQHRHLLKMLRRKPYTLKASLLKDGSLSLGVHNTGSKVLSGNIILKAMPKGWKCSNSKMVINTLMPGKQQQQLFHFSNAEITDGNIYNFSMQIHINGSEENAAYRFQPYRAKYAKNLTDKKNMVWYTLDSRNREQRASASYIPGNLNFQARFAANWNESGIYLIVKVLDRKFDPPETAKKMWNNDSLVVYFDQLNNGVPGISCYDADDRPYRAGLVNNKVEVRSGKNNGPRKKVKAKITHSGEYTVYKLLFPAGEFSDVKLQKGINMGFSLEVINLLKNGKTAVLIPHQEHPHLSPGTWADLYLEK